jgi:hypothetical protein
MIRWDEWIELPADAPAWQKLASLMSGLSEAGYCASWESGLERDMWALMHSETPGKVEYGMTEIEPEEIAMLRDLSRECGGWCVLGHDGESVFVPLAEWLAIYGAAP